MRARRVPLPGGMFNSVPVGMRHGYSVLGAVTVASAASAAARCTCRGVEVGYSVLRRSRLWHWHWQRLRVEVTNGIPQ